MGPTHSVGVTGSDQVVRAVQAYYRGFTVRETSGSATALVRIFDNASAASGTVLDEIALNSGESAREWYESGVWATSGIYVDVVSGAAAGSIRVG